MRLLKIALTLLVFIPSLSFAWTPPTGSPMATGVHPRLGFIDPTYKAAHPENIGLTVEELRTKLALTTPYNYKADFETFVNEVEANTYSLNVGDYSFPATRVLAICDMRNFAFLAMLDPANMSGFSFTTTHTVAQYKAKALAIYDVLVAGVLAADFSDAAQVKAWADRYTTYYKGTTDGWGEGPITMGLAVVYDWLKADLSTQQKSDLWDANVKLAAYLMDNLEEWGVSANWFGKNHMAAGILAMYGDGFDSTEEATLCATFDTIWNKGSKEIQALFFENSVNALDGPAYWAFVGTGLAGVYPLISSATEDNWYESVPFVRDNAYYRAYTILPMAYDYSPPDEIDIRTLSSDDCGTHVAGDLNYYSKELDFYASTAWAPEPQAELASWLRTNKFRLDALDAVTFRRHYAAMYRYLGAAIGSGSSPTTLELPLSKNLGGSYYMRGGWGAQSGDTHVAFIASEWFTEEAHSHWDMASFSVFKYGYLIRHDRQISKGYTSNIEKTRRAMFRNTIGVLNPAETATTNFMGYRENLDDHAYLTTDAAFQINGVNHMGEVVAEKLNETTSNTGFDYIDYDYSDSWYDAKVDYAERELVNLRSAGGTNDEYVVVYDRINSADAAYKKYFLLHVTDEPIITGAGTETSEGYPTKADDGGRWIYPDSDSDSLITVQTDYNEFHGKLFSRMLLPSAFQINKIGGPNHQWEDAYGYPLASQATMSPLEQVTWGEYGLQIQSDTGLAYDQFLNVMQVGSSTTDDGATVLSSMSDLEAITATTGSTGGMTGVNIQDSTRNRVLLFNDQKSTVVSKQSAPIVYTTTVTAASDHLLTNVVGDTWYEITAGGSVLTTAHSTADGVLSFSDTTNTNGSVTYNLSTGSAPVSRKPSNLKFVSP